MSSEYLCVHAEINFTQEGLEEGKKAFQHLRTESRKEPGVVTYNVIQDNDEPTRIYCYEEYADKQAFDAHLASDHFKAFAGKRTLFASAPIVRPSQAI